jgi:hypothetical protein
MPTSSIRSGGDPFGQVWQVYWGFGLLRLDGLLASLALDRVLWRVRGVGSFVEPPRGRAAGTCGGSGGNGSLAAQDTPPFEPQPLTMRLSKDGAPDSEAL